MDVNQYRVIVTYFKDQNVFKASVPELAGCTAEGPTRTEAMAKVEEEMTALLENMKEQGIEPPTPINEQEFDGNVTMKITPALHRDLVFMAKVEQVELDVLLAEILTHGIAPKGFSRHPRSENRGGRGSGARGQRYYDIMENRENFIEYVRSIESSGRSSGKGRNKPPRDRQNKR